jgi:hypothetical protein
LHFSGEPVIKACGENKCHSKIKDSDADTANIQRPALDLLQFVNVPKYYIVRERTSLELKN